MRRRVAVLACVLLSRVAAPLSAQTCLGVPSGPDGARAVVVPSAGAASGGTELGLSSGYAHRAGIGARAEYTTTRNGGDPTASHAVSAEVGYEVGGLIGAWVPGLGGGRLSACPVLGLGRLDRGALSGLRVQSGVAAGTVFALTGSADWLLHPYGGVALVRETRRLEFLRRTERAYAMRGGLLLARGAWLGGVEAEKRGVFADDPSVRFRFGYRF